MSLINLPPSPLPAGTGIEIGRFRLRPGVDEAALLAAMRRMEEKFLARQPGFAAHHVVGLDDGWYLDVTLADDRATAVRLCAGWAKHPACEAVLALIEVPENALEFGHFLA